MYVSCTITFSRPNHKVAHSERPTLLPNYRQLSAEVTSALSTLKVLIVSQMTQFGKKLFRSNLSSAQNLHSHKDRKIPISGERLRVQKLIKFVLNFPSRSKRII